MIHLKPCDFCWPATNNQEIHSIYYGDHLVQDISDCIKDELFVEQQVHIYGDDQFSKILDNDKSLKEQNLLEDCTLYICINPFEIDTYMIVYIVDNVILTQVSILNLDCTISELINYLQEQELIQQSNITSIELLNLNGDLLASNQAMQLLHFSDIKFFHLKLYTKPKIIIQQQPKSQIQIKICPTVSNPQKGPETQIISQIQPQYQFQQQSQSQSLQQIQIQSQFQSKPIPQVQIQPQPQLKSQPQFQILNQIQPQLNVSIKSQIQPQKIQQQQPQSISQIQPNSVIKIQPQPIINIQPIPIPILQPQPIPIIQPQIIQPKSVIIQPKPVLIIQPLLPTQSELQTVKNQQNQNQSNFQNFPFQLNQMNQDNDLQKQIKSFLNFSIKTDLDGERVEYEYHFPLHIKGFVTKKKGKNLNINLENFNFQELNKIKYVQNDEFGFIIQWDNQLYSQIKIKQMK